MEVFGWDILILHAFTDINCSILRIYFQSCTAVGDRRRRPLATFGGYLDDRWGDDGGGRCCANFLLRRYEERWDKLNIILSSTHQIHNTNTALTFHKAGRGEDSCGAGGVNAGGCNWGNEWAGGSWSHCGHWLLRSEGCCCAIVEPRGCRSSFDVCVVLARDAWRCCFFLCCGQSLMVVLPYKNHF